MLKSLGVTKGEKSIARSHIVIGKGGAIEDVQIGVSPGASLADLGRTSPAHAVNHIQSRCPAC